MSGIMLYKHRLHYQGTLQKQLRSSKETSFGFFLKDESFVSKTLNEGHVELNKSPASKVRQMAKKLQSSQSTARHIKKMSSEPQATQIHLLRHQRTELPPTNFQRKQNIRFKQRQPPNKKYQEDQYRERKPQAKERLYKNSQEHTGSENKCTFFMVIAHI